MAAGFATGTATAALAELQPRGDHRAAAVAASGSNMTGLGLGPLTAGLFAEYVAMPTHSVFWAYLGLGLPVVLADLISQEVGPVNASAYVSGLAAAAVVVAFIVVLRTFGVAAVPTTPCTPSDSWCHPGAPDGLSAGTQPAAQAAHRSS